jgi:hypothetical protein
VLLHQAGLRVSSRSGSSSNSSNSLTGTLCVSSENDIQEALQIVSAAEQRCVGSNHKHA